MKKTHHHEFRVIIHAVIVVGCLISAGGCVTIRGDSMEQMRTTDARSVVKFTTSRMIVGYDPEYGFLLRKEDSLDKVLFVEFENNEVSLLFRNFFDQSNLAKHDGQRILCICEFSDEGISKSPGHVLVRKAEFFVE